MTKTQDINESPVLEASNLSRLDPKLSTWIMSSICFVITMIGSLAQNLSRGSKELVFVFDSGHYLGSCTKICTLWQTILHQGFSAGVKDQMTGLTDSLLLDGPVLPMITSSFFLVTNRIPSYMDTQIVVVEQALIQALSAFLMFFVARRFTSSNRWAIVGSLLWGLYPAALIGAGRLLPETTTAMLLVSLVLTLSTVITDSISHKLRARLLTVLGGWLSALLLLAKPALGPSTFIVDVIFLLTVRPIKQMFVSAVLLFIGGMIALSPWMAYTYASTGQAMVTAQRVPVFNIVNGLDQESNGWASIPPSRFVNLFAEGLGIGNVTLSIFKAEPEKTTTLVLRKIPRLWQVPWNDFRSKVAGISCEPQIWWHQLLCLLGIFGGLAFFANAKLFSSLASSTFEQKSIRFIGYASAILLLGHVIYAGFLASARYGFTALPLFTLFATYTLMRLALVTWRTKLISLAASSVIFLIISQADIVPYLAALFGPNADLKWFALVIQLLVAGDLLRVLYSNLNVSNAGEKFPLSGKAAFALFFVAYAIVRLAFTLDHTAANEWGATLKPGEQAVRQIAASGKEGKKPEWALVVFDGDFESRNAKVKVNGHYLAESPNTLYLFNAADAGLSQFQVFSALLRMPAEKLRQWRAVPVPTSLLNDTGNNEIAIEPAGNLPITIYGGYPSDSKGTWSVPSFNLFSPTKLVNSTDTLECRPISIQSLQTSNTESWLQNSKGKHTDDLSPTFGKQFGQYRILLMLGYPQEKSASAAKQKAVTQEIPTAKEIDLTPSPVTLSGTPKLFHFEIPSALRKQGHVSVAISGTLSAQEKNKVTIQGTVSEGMTTVFFFPGTPHMIDLDRSSKTSSTNTKESYPGSSSPKDSEPEQADFNLQGQIACDKQAIFAEIVEFSFVSLRPGTTIKNFKARIAPSNLANFSDHEIKVY